MDKELIERLAKEAGFVQGNKPEQLLWSHRFGGWLEIRELHRFAAVVAEECAKVCDVADARETAKFDYAAACAAQGLAEAIRAKFKP